MQQPGGQKWKRYASIGIIVWAAALQGHMWYLKSTDEFKRKFPEVAADDADSSWSFKLKRPGASD